MLNNYVSAVLVLLTIIFIITGPDAPSWYISSSTQSPYLIPPCTISMFNFHEYKRVNQIWYSNPFYSEMDGYKFYLRVHANGTIDGEGTHVSIYVILMKGEHDEMLKWPFKGEITIQLLNWKEDKGHVVRILDFCNAPLESRTRVTDKEGRGWGYSKFISHIDVECNPDESIKYLQDGILCFEISKVTLHTGNTNQYLYHTFNNSPELFIASTDRMIAEQSASAVI